MQKPVDDGRKRICYTIIVVLVLLSNLVPQKSLFTTSSFLSPFLFYEEQGQRRKEKSEGGDEPALSARTSRDSVPTVNSTESLKKSFVPFSPVAVPEILCSLFARRISTAATRPSPLLPPPAARRRAPPPPPGRGMSRVDQTLPSRDLFEY